jgi:hypothetical protein
VRNWRALDQVGLSVGGPGLSHGLVIIRQVVEEHGDGTETRSWVLRHWQKFEPSVTITELAHEIRKLHDAYDTVNETTRFTRFAVDCGNDSIVVEHLRDVLRSLPGLSRINVEPFRIVESRVADDGSTSRMDIFRHFQLCLANGAFQVLSDQGREWAAEALAINTDAAWRASDADLIPSTLALALWMARKATGPLSDELRRDIALHFC